MSFKKQVQELINLRSGRAEVFLPKGATNIKVVFENRCPYLCALVDSEEEEKEKYLVLSYEDSQKVEDDNEIKFLKKVYIIGAGIFFLYYKKTS